MFKRSVPFVVNLFTWSFFIVINSSNLAYAQRCPVPQLLEQRENNHPELSTKQFEYWLQQKALNRKLKNLSGRSADLKTQKLQVPVVVHIIHKGEEIGNGSNLSKSRIDRQLEILNEDFNKNNSDTTQTLTEFKALAANVEIEFVYARQDPDGLETTGIVRVLGSQNSFSYSSRDILSAESYWPAEDYLNIWVADLANSSLGWAEFPVSNLPGLDEASNNRLIDGVTIDYEFFGENPESPGFESVGRTATHEMGHFFGLRHIWGDGGCSVDDYCEDTPAANTSSTGCNLSKSTCSSLDMVQNFMDYTNDVCMNLFTVDQKERMRIVADNSPRRQSLTVSKGLSPPPVYDNDLAVKPIHQLYNSNCSQLYTPTVSVKNAGLLAANNFQVFYSIDNELQETLLIENELSPGKSVDINFTPIIVNQPGTIAINFQVEMDPTLVDQRLENNTLKEFFQVLPQANLPYQKSFVTTAEPWLVRNQDQEETWSPLNGYFGIPFFSNKRNIGEKEALISPVFNLTELNKPELSFVFSQSADTVPHRISIYASFDCGENFDELIYSSVKKDLISAYANDLTFVPQYRLDWDKISVDLGQYANASSVAFNIIAENRNGNNLYLGNFTVEESLLAEKQISPIKWLVANPLYCGELRAMELAVQNTGNSTISSFQLDVLEEGVSLYSQTINQIIPAGEQQIVSIPALQPTKSSGKLLVYTSVANANQMITDSLAFPFQTDCKEELAPLRLSLTNSSTDNWYVFNPNQNSTWQYNENMQLLSSNSALVNLENQEDWLVTPLLDVSRVLYLGLIFDISYRKPFRQSESLKIFMSDENGEVFNTLIYDKQGDSLATSFGNDENADPVWRNEFIDLSPYVFREKIRLAFKASHDNGQNIYLKNISFFIGDTPPPPYPATGKAFVIYPNPASSKINLHLNLPEASEGYFQITDLRGTVLLSFDEPKLLNQFISFDVSSLADGMYLLHLRTDQIRTSSKFIVKRQAGR